jgi:hypothetical protein
LKCVSIKRIMQADKQFWIFRCLARRIYDRVPYQGTAFLSAMHLLNQIVLLFGLNLLDALLTIFWVRSGVATEGNQLMAELLDIGNFPFLLVKVAIGAVTAVVLFKYANSRLARFGLTVSLAVYIGLMGVHFFTGLSAFGYVSDNVLSHFSDISSQFFAALL